jgi:DNA end-binding protein Ku
MAHAIWKGTVSFGLVNIPVALYPAESTNELHFSMLDKKDLSPVGYRPVNKSTGKDIERSQVVKGFEYEEGQYVIVTDEDLKRANVEATQTVDIQDFVDLKDIDPVYFDKPYYLAPVKKGEKAYALLRETLKRTGKVGIAKVVIRTRQYVAALYPLKNALVVNLLRYPHELRKADDLGLPGGNLKELGLTDRELTMAEKLVDGMVSEWEPEKYKDEYRKDLLDFIETKAREGDVRQARVPVKAEAKGGEVLDLMELLKKSIDQTGQKAPRAAARKSSRTSTRKAGGSSKSRKSA